MATQVTRPAAAEHAQSSHADTSSARFAPDVGLAVNEAQSALIRDFHLDNDPHKESMRKARSGRIASLERKEAPPSDFYEAAGTDLGSKHVWGSPVKP